MVITVDKSAERILADRAQRLTPNGPPIRLTPLEQTVQFLRGVHSRATMTLPAFYLHLGATADSDPPCSIAGYPGLVLKHSLQFSSIGTVALACRKAFDHAAKGLTGTNFAKSTDETLTKVAEYWSNKIQSPYSGCTRRFGPAQVGLPGLCETRNAALGCFSSFGAAHRAAQTVCRPRGGTPLAGQLRIFDVGLWARGCCTDGHR